MTNNWPWLDEKLIIKWFKKENVYFISLPACHVAISQTENREQVNILLKY